VLRLGRKYDLTIISLTAQLKESAFAARAKAKKQADEKFMKDAEATAKQVIAADEAGRKVQAAGLSDAPLKALAENKTPVPLPENAENVKFVGDDGRLEFSSASSVKALVAFHRASLKSAGWNERPSVINQPNMAMLELAKSSKSISFTVMQMGPKVRVSAEGTGLRVEPKWVAKALEPLKNDPGVALPAPTRRSSIVINAIKLPGSDQSFRTELEASIRPTLPKCSPSIAQS
jgi:hypothetical protein